MSHYILIALASVGAFLVAWVVMSGETSVGSGLSRRKVTRSGQPVQFTFEVLKLIILVGVALLLALGFYVRPQGW